MPSGWPSRHPFFASTCHLGLTVLLHSKNHRRTENWPYWVDDKMKVIYSKHYNINLGLLNYLHPFDGTKFQTIHDGLKNNDHIEFIGPSEPASMEIIDEFLSSIMRHRVRDKNGIFQALEVPRLPFISFSFLDRKILTPMRWAVAGTILGATQALKDGGIYWNVSGGYHHAMQQNMEGSCIYNGIGIAVAVMGVGINDQNFVIGL